MQTVQPNKGQLFCRPDEVEEKTTSGFYLDKKHVEKPKTAEVVNAGKGCTYEAGDRVIYKSYTTTEIKLNNEDFMLVAEEDVLGKVLEV